METVQIRSSEEKTRTLRLLNRYHTTILLLLPRPGVSEPIEQGAGVAPSEGHLMDKTTCSQRPYRNIWSPLGPTSGKKLPSIALILVTSFVTIGPATSQEKQPVKPAVAPGQALTAAQKKQVNRWIQELGDRRYATRQQAQTHLLTMGWPAIPYLSQAHRDPNPERRFRARQLSHEIRHRRAYREFQQLGKQPDKTMDLDKAMIAIARVIDPMVDDADLNRQLDQLASQVRKKLGPNVSPAEIAPAKAVAVIQQVLFKQHGFTGEIANYDHPSNSSLAHVLKNRKGLPILLSHVVVSVAERVDLPFVGVPIAGRYMVKYDGAQAPAGAPRQDILLDPFGGGKILTWEQLQTMIPGLDRETALDASPKRDTVVRMLRNLEADYLETGDLEAAERTAGYRWLVER